MKKFYSEEQVRLAIKRALEYYEWEPMPDMQGIEDSFWELLAVSDDMEGVQHSITIEEGSVL